MSYGWKVWPNFIILSHFGLFKTFAIFIYLFFCVYKWQGWGRGGPFNSFVESRRQFGTASSLLPACESWDWTLAGVLLSWNILLVFTLASIKTSGRLIRIACPWPSISETHGHTLHKQARLGSFLQQLVISQLLQRTMRQRENLIDMKMKCTAMSSPISFGSTVWSSQTVWRGLLPLSKLLKPVCQTLFRKQIPYTGIWG